jgi:hypothetical protein
LKRFTLPTRHLDASYWTGIAILVGCCAVLVGCSAQLGDRGGKEGSPVDVVSDVDYVEVFRNADNMPNIARICVDGIGFAATSSGPRGESAVASPALLRMTEWDQLCLARRVSP